MENEQAQSRLELDEHSSYQLAQAARWAKFVGISGIVLGGLMILGGVFINALLSSGAQGGMAMPMESMKGLISFVYVLAGIISGLVSFFLFRFASQATTALAYNRQDYLAHAFKNLKMVYRVIGVIIISYIFISVLSMVITAISGAGR